MCGIAGAINFKPDMDRLTADLLHRGPDAQNTYVYENVTLHHHRLSIVDIAAGIQPMHYKHFTIIFNGEIYNHQAVRQKLCLQGKTASDTETILLAYEKLGPACLDEFDGMFVFVILDKQKQELFMARDRAGKKPLYYYKEGNNFFFSSELHSIKNQLPLTIDERAIQQYFRLGYFYKTKTPYRYVYELAAGSYATVPLTLYQVNIKKWWNVQDFYLQNSTDSLEQALEKTDNFLHQAVKRRVESSDLEVGSFLSGGIDSGLVTAIAKEYNPGLKTFTVSFDGAYNEAPLARLVAQKYGTLHTEVNISFDTLPQDVETILGNYGEPFFDSSAIPSYYVSREAKKHLTVILNGDGGDELFGGYRRYVPFARYDFLNTGNFYKKTATALLKILPPPQNKKSKYNFLYRLLAMGKGSGTENYLSATIDIFEGYQQFLLADAGYMDGLSSEIASLNALSLSGLKKIMLLDFENILAGNLLVKMDIATMAHSLEGRSPLLSKELLEYIPTLPGAYKIKGGTTKFLLRTLAKKYLPEELIYQPKRGFEIPLKDWMDGVLKELAGDYIFNRNAYWKQYVQPEFVQNLWDKKINTGAEKRAKMLWSILALEIWYSKYYSK